MQKSLRSGAVSAHLHRLQTQSCGATRRPSESRSRVSWMTTPIDDSPSSEAQFENMLDPTRPIRHVPVPPLPAVPEHLIDTQAQFLSAPGRGAPGRNELSSPEQYTIVLRMEEPVPAQQGSHVDAYGEQIEFRQDHQQQLELRSQHQHSYPHEPSPTYDASQYEYQHLSYKELGMVDSSTAAVSMSVTPSHVEHLTGTLQSAQAGAGTRSCLTTPPSKKMLEIGPDTNPLTPTSPCTAQLPKLAATTNIAVLRPSQPVPMTFGAPVLPFHTTRQPVRGGSWHHSLFSCASPGLCLASSLCPCLIYGRTQYRLSAKSAGRDPTNMLGFSFLNGSCLAWSLLPGMNILLSAIQHTRVRKAYDMDDTAGGMASACVQSTCCCCCVIAQDEKEMQWREDRDKPGCKEEGYRSVDEMKFAPR